MKILTCITWLWITLLIGSAQASLGEIRVLLRFDNAGHHVAQIFESKATTDVTRLLSSALKPGESSNIKSLVAALEPRVATLVWIDAQGRWLSSTTEPDPRISHSPAHIYGAATSRVVGQVGAWLVAGPGTASSLTILLPEDPTLGLGFEQWNLMLDYN